LLQKSFAQQLYCQGVEDNVRRKYITEEF